MPDEIKGSGGDGEAGGHAVEPGRSVRADRPVHTIVFTMPSVPSKGRPRFRAMGKHGRAYTPKRTLEQEAEIRQYFMLASRREPVTLPWKGLVAVSIHVVRGAPTTRPRGERRVMEESGLECVTKPDVDNIAKIVMDALRVDPKHEYDQNRCYVDDAQVWFIQVEKRYGKVPATTVRIMLFE